MGPFCVGDAVSTRSDFHDKSEAAFKELIDPNCKYNLEDLIALRSPVCHYLSFAMWK